MTSKHTPGPWRVAAPPNKVCTDYRGASGNMLDTNWASGGRAKTIVICEGRAWMEEGEELANASLIAAAPELLKALRDIVDSPESQENSYDCFQGIKDIARAAIAKAEDRP